MKLTIIKTLLPYLLTALVSVGGLGYVLHLHSTNKQLQWELNTTTREREELSYELEKEREWQAKEREWQLQMNKRFEELNTQVRSYTKQLKEIENERSEAGISNSLSDDVTRVLKSFNNHQD